MPSGRTSDSKASRGVARPFLCPPLASIPGCRRSPVGTAWLESPGWLDVFHRVPIRQRETFASSATPTVGTVREQPKTLAAVDLEWLRQRPAGMIKRTRAEHPRALRRRAASSRGNFGSGLSRLLINPGSGASKCRPYGMTR